MAATGVPLFIPAVAANGTVASSFKLNGWVPTSAGAPTATRRTFYTDPELATPAANPATLGAAGRVVYVNPALSYAFTITDAAEAVTYDTIYVPAELDAAGAAVLTALNVATYAALTALTAAVGLVDNGIYYTYARTTEEDGGAGFWRYDSASTATANGGTIMAIDGGGAGRFFRLYTGALQARWFTPFDNSTDETTTLQAAITAATNAVLDLPPATALVTQLTLPNNIRIVGMGPGITTIKRKNSTGAITSVLYATGKNNITLEDFTVDGNKANQTNAATNIAYDTSCYNVHFKNIETKNAKAVGGSFGSGITLADTADFTNDTWSSVEGCTIRDNDTYGLNALRCLNLRLENNLAEGQTSNAGLAVNDFTLPVPSSPTNQYIIVVGNIMKGNASGLEMFGFRSSNTAIGDVGSDSNFISRAIVIADNVAYSNTGYGLAVQADSVSITGNILDSNGSNTSNGNMLLNARYFSCTGNIFRRGYYFGLDAGGSRDGLIVGNEFHETGNVANQCIALNLGAVRYATVRGNKFSLNGGTGASGGAYNIFATRYDGASATNWLPWSGTQLTIEQNDITINDTDVVGINVSQGYEGVTIRKNVIRLVAAGTPLQIYTPGASTLIEDNQVYSESGTTWTPTVTSAATIVVPDYGSHFAVSGTATISNIRTTSSDFMYQKVGYVIQTSGGSGYTSQPTVSFTGGGGSGAAGVAALGADGVVYGVYMTNYGSGYTSTPTVGFSGGGGSGAAATAYVGIEPPYGREITLLFADAAILDTGPGNLYLASDKTGSAFGLSWTKLGLRFGNAYEISRGV
jgi:hypothetical protein